MAENADTRRRFRYAIVEYTDSEIIIRLPYTLHLEAGGAEPSRREMEVLRLVRQGLANKEIAHTLNISERTVKFHVSALLLKFNVTERRNL